MSSENVIATSYKVGSRILRKRDGKIGEIIKLLDTGLLQYLVRFVDDQDEEMAEGEILPVTPESAAEVFTFAAKVEKEASEQSVAPISSTPEQIREEARRIAGNIDKAYEGEARHNLATHLIYVSEGSEKGLHLLETTNLPTQEIIQRLNRETPRLFGNGAEKVALPDSIELSEEAAIPPFDPTVMNGIYAEFAELVTRGTTLPPQFAFAISKVIVGARMAGKVEFENLDVEPRYYVPLIGVSGTGKGETWRRMFKVLHPDGAIIKPKIKIINSADSGAGLRDCFFEPPEDEPILCFVDEVTSLGNKSAATRNPGILDTMIELADSTSISRVLAKREGGGTKTKHNARFVMVMCGQDGMTFAQAFAGRAKLGLWDRLYPEFAVPVEPGDLPPVNNLDAIKLLTKLDSMDFSGTMDIPPEAKSRLDDFWMGQPSDTRTKARWKKNLNLDSYMSAFGRGLKTVELSDAEIAIKIFIRQVKIRQACFTIEVPDRIGHYLALIKQVTENMRRQQAAGVKSEVVAQSRRDFEKKTNATRDNEEHIFAKAWEIYSRVHLVKVAIKKANGQSYEKFLPLMEE